MTGRNTAQSISFYKKREGRVHSQRHSTLFVLAPISRSGRFDRKPVCLSLAIRFDSNQIQRGWHIFSLFVGKMIARVWMKDWSVIMAKDYAEKNYAQKNCVPSRFIIMPATESFFKWLGFSFKLIITHLQKWHSQKLCKLHSFSNYLKFSLKKFS